MTDRLLLVVEGADDKRVIEAIRDRHAFEPKFGVEKAGGYENLRKGLPVRLKPGTDLERLGIVVDADSDVLTRWYSIRDVLNQAGYADVPDRPDPTGTVVDHEFLPRVGVWLMPDNLASGMLEDYLTFLVPAGDTLLERARQSLEEIPPEERRFAQVHHSKALIHTWLAWQESPGTPLGLAITRRYLSAEGTRASAFITWLTRLFA